MRDLETILSKFSEIVSPNFCNDQAKKCKFVHRSTSQIKGYEFAQAMAIPNGFLEAETLNSLAVRMRNINNRCDLTAPALAQRINSKEAELFMKACFGAVLKETVKKDFESLEDLPNLSSFKRVYIQDSSQAELHQKLSPDFKGSGGVASTASVKFDFIFDYLSEQIVDVSFFSGNTPDQKLADRLTDILEENDLVLRDLGYFITNKFIEIEKKGAFFISRWKVSENVYEYKEDKIPLNLAEFLDRHAAKGVIDVQLFIGKDRLPVRLVASLMSEQGVNQRLRKANSGAKKRGTQISKKKRSLLKYSIFITNIPSPILSSCSIMAVYRARWRVELVFKTWKSCLKIHLFKGYKLERFYCFLYGRMIMILLLGFIYPILMKYASELGRELSCYKVTNYMIADHLFAGIIHNGNWDQFIKKLLKDLPRRLCMDKRKRLTLRENVRQGVSYYNDLEINDLYKKIGLA